MKTIMTRVKACEEKTPDRSSPIFAGFSNPRASTNRNSEGQELHLYFERKSPVLPILSMNKSSSEGLDTSHKIQISCQGHTRRAGNSNVF